LTLVGLDAQDLGSKSCYGLLDGLEHQALWQCLPTFETQPHDPFCLLQSEVHNNSSRIVVGFDLALLS